MYGTAPCVSDLRASYDPIVFQAQVRFRPRSAGKEVPSKSSAAERGVAAGRPLARLSVADLSGVRACAIHSPRLNPHRAARHHSGRKSWQVLAVEKNQCLGFDPVDGCCLGRKASPTIGVPSAPMPAARPSAPCAARDSCCPSAVNGSGEAFRGRRQCGQERHGVRSGPTLCAAHFGTLCVLTELTIPGFPKAPPRLHCGMNTVSPEGRFPPLRKIWQSALGAHWPFYLPAARVNGLTASRPRPCRLKEKMRRRPFSAGGGEDSPAIFRASGHEGRPSRAPIRVWRIFRAVGGCKGPRPRSTRRCVRRLGGRGDLGGTARDEASRVRGAGGASRGALHSACGRRPSSAPRFDFCPPPPALAAITAVK